MHFNPRRPTFIRMRDAGVLWDRQRVEPLCVNSIMDHLSDVGMVSELDLGGPISCQMSIFFVPKGYLIIEDLDKHMEVKGGNNFTVWTGEELELESCKRALEK